MFFSVKLSSYMDERSVALEGRKCAVLICDAWNAHWCGAAKARMDELAPKIEEFLRSARALDLHVIHSPSGTMAFYTNYSQRRRAKRFVEIPTFDPAPAEREWPMTPVKGQGEPCKGAADAIPARIFREHLSISVGPHDIISDDVNEIMTYVRQARIETVFFCGVHMNMCVLDNPFGIKNMSRYGISCVLLRDLTDPIFCPIRYPSLTQEEGKRLIAEFIERHICPTALADDLEEATCDRR